MNFLLLLHHHRFLVRLCPYLALSHTHSHNSSPFLSLSVSTSLFLFASAVTLCAATDYEAFTFIAFSLPFPPSPGPFLPLLPLRPLLSVHALVPPQVPEGTAGVAAVVAAVRLLARVRAGVALQVNELGGGVGADGAAVGLVAVVDPHVALQVVGVVRGEGAQRAGVQFGAELAGPARASPLPGGAVADGGFSHRPVLRLRGVDGGLVLQALLTGQAVELGAQVQAHTCSTRDSRREVVSGRSRLVHRGSDAPLVTQAQARPQRRVSQQLTAALTGEEGGEGGGRRSRQVVFNAQREDRQT